MCVCVFRFPCCGKAYPCDVCHDDAERDHEMKYANRMICGFCAKEQVLAVVLAAAAAAAAMVAVILGADSKLGLTKWQGYVVVRCWTCKRKVAVSTRSRVAIKWLVLGWVTVCEKVNRLLM